jgi:Snare region-containing protein
MMATIDVLLQSLRDALAQGEFDEVKSLLEDMVVQLHNVPTERQRYYLAEIHFYHQQLDREQRRPLMHSVDVTAQRGRNSLAILQDARGQLVEMEVVAIDIQGRLSNQRDTVERTQGRMQHLRGNLGYAHGLLDRMKAWWRG